MTMTRTTKLFAVSIAVSAAACGGHKPPPPQDEGTTPLVHGNGGDQSDHGGNMIPPEQMDEINRDLARKQQIVSHCLASAIDSKEVPKNSHGKVTLEIVISQAGRADSVKVINATLESKSLNECVISHVKEIQFPTLSKSFETSYTFAFEAS
jgi:hypothetical protein